MQSVLLVDDEALARTGLRLLIDWEGIGFDRVFEAASVEEALSVLQQHPVDVVIADVVMPDNDGIELARRIHHSWPSTITILVTSYEDFENARRAVSSGAVVLLSKRDLTAARLKRELRTAVGDDTLQPEYFGSDAVLADALNQVLDRSDPGDSGELLGHVAGAVGAVRIPDKADKDLLENTFRGIETSVVVVRRDAVWIAARRGNDVPFARLMQRVTARLGPEAAARWVVLQSGPRAALNALEVLRRWLNTEFWQPLRGVDELTPNRPEPAIVDEALPRAVQQNLQEQFAHGDEEQLSAAVSEAAEYARDTGVTPVRFRLAVLVSIAAAVASSHTTPANVGERLVALGRPQMYRTWRAVLDAVCALRREWRGHLASTRQSDPRIAAALDHIESALPHRLAVEDLASVAGTSVSAFSRLFRRSLGCTYRDYVAMRRVQRAQHIMAASPHLLVYQVAEEVGFDDVRQFNRMFAKWVGIRPNDYKQQVLGG